MTRASAHALLLLVALTFSLRARGETLTSKAIDHLVRSDRIVLRESARWDPPPPADDPLAQYTHESEQAFPRTMPKPAAFDELASRLAASRYVLVGDVHSNAMAQTNMARVLTAMAGAGDPSRPLTAVIEWIDAKHQKTLDDYLAGKISLEQVRRDADYDAHWPFAWSHYAPILKAARELGVRVLAAETGREGRELGERDEAISQAIAHHQAQNPDSRYLVMYGESHILGEEHLASRLARHGFEPQLVVLQSMTNADYWRELRRLRDAGKMSVLKLGAQAFFLDSGNPLVADFQYLRYLARLAGAEPRILELGRKLGLTGLFDDCASLLVK